MADDSHSEVSDNEIPDEGEDRYLSVTQAIKLVPKKFDGNKSELREFIAGVETAFEVVHPNKRHLFLKFIEARITGDAKTKLLARSERTNWEQIKAILEENYSTRRTIDFYACKLFNSRQGANEGVASWGSRIDGMSSELTEAMVRLLPACHREGAIAFLKFISKACFIQGLHDERIQTVVRAKDERMLLPNAVETALEEESAILSGRYKRQSVPQNKNSNSRPQGNFDGDKGSGNRNFNFKRTSNSQHVNMICYRCQEEGHFSKECTGIPKCAKCSELGHETRDCRSGGSRQGNGSSEGLSNRGSPRS